MFQKILIVVILNLILFVLNIYSYYLNQIKEIKLIMAPIIKEKVVNDGYFLYKEKKEELSLEDEIIEDKKINKKEEKKEIIKEPLNETIYEESYIEEKPYILEGIKDIHILKGSSYDELFIALCKDIKTNQTINFSMASIDLSKAGIYELIYHIGDQESTIKVYVDE